ncbi:hypothetical protein HYZ41_03220 [archaeon]|nr:hypothetical protein [archaeon]
MKNDKERFEKVYFNLPEAEKKLAIVIINEKQITWDEAYIEIKKDTELGKSIIEKLIKHDII